MIRMKDTTARTTRRTDALSKDRIIAAAIRILDREGERGLTFRALAADLATGAGAIYWHVANKNELLAEATNAVITPLLDNLPPHHDAREDLRAIALGLFDAAHAHPWLGSQVLHASWQLSVMLLFEAIGSKLTQLGVPREARFNVASALVGYIAGKLGQETANMRNSPAGMTRETFLAMAADQWKALDPEEFPFVHEIADQLRDHDDREQFLAGLDLMLTGIAHMA